MTTKFILLLIGFQVVAASSSSSREVEHMKGSTFKYFAQKLKPGQAQAECEKWGGNLASLFSVKKRNFVKSMIPAGKNVWIGAACKVKGKDCTLTTEDNWKWRTGEPLCLTDPIWGLSNGKQMPYDDYVHDAFSVTIWTSLDDGECHFGNYAGSLSFRPFLCEK